VLKKISLFHIIPFLLACLTFYLVYFLIFSNLIDKHVNIEQLKTKVISGKQVKISGKYGNLSETDQAELEFVASIKNKNQLTLMGSSEFSYTPYATYNFLPINKNYQIIGIGHAHHQNLSILIELLATHKENENTKIVFFVSPGWFEGKGTNSEAFIEFAKPNLLNRIANNTAINQKYKSYIGQYIDSRLNEFEGVSKSMTYFRDIFISNQNKYLSSNKFEQYIKTNFSGTKTKTVIQDVDYQPELSINNSKNVKINYDSIASQLQTEFIANIDSNSIYVYDEYYNKYLIDDNGEEKFGNIDKPNIKTNEEYRDFKLLVEYVTERKMNASFIIIPYNPYYYRNTEIYLPLIDSLTTLLDNNNFPYYNLYAGDTLNYEPGTLKDVMHFGDYGWMKVNKYIDSLYYGNN